MKKIFIIAISIIIGLFSPVFSLTINEKLNTIFEKKIDSKIEHKYQSKQKVCKAKKLVYNKLINKLKTIKKKKYQKLIKIIINFTENRKRNIKECEIKKQNKSIDTKNPVLHFKIDKTVLKNSLFKQTNIEKYIGVKKDGIHINKFEKIQSKIGNKYFKIKNHRYLITKSSYTTSTKKDNQILKYVQDKYPNQIIMEYIGTNKYIIYIIEKEDIKNLQGINPNNNLAQNTSNLEKLGVLYLNNFYWKKIDNKTLIGGISELGDNLIYFITGGKTKFYITDKVKDIYHLIIKYPNIKYIVKNNNKYYLRLADNVKIYNLGNKKIYNNINKKILGKLLFSSFYRIIIHKLPYSYKDMYKIILIAKRFDDKKLKKLYLYLTKNFKYNKTISKLLEDKISQEKLEEYIKNHRNISKFWNIFYIINKKEAICQSFSELLSLLSLFNGQKSDIIIGSIGYSHQISKINNFYYDVTGDLGKKENLRYFGMTKKETEKYFTFK